MMLIEAEGLTKRFGRVRALDGAGFALAPGEVVGLAGPNGAGKTTLIRLLMGLLELHGGRLRVLAEEPARRRHLGRVGWMAEQPVFPPGWRVQRLIDFQAATLPAWDRELATALAARLELDGRARAGDLSRGRRARLAMLLALGHRPDLLLLDDPTLGLDPAGRRLLLGEILGAAAEAGTGILVATHLLRETEPALDRLLILHRGRIVLDEAVESLRRRWRRLRLPPSSPAVPAALSPKTAGGEHFSTRWDADEWRRWAGELPGADAEPVDLEDIFIAHTGGAL